MTNQELYAQAGENVNELLKQEGLSVPRSHDAAILELDDELASERYVALSDLLSVRKDLEQEFENVRRTLDRAVPYMHGKPGMWNSCGLLQASGPAIDRMAAVFTERHKAAVKAELAVLRALDRAKSQADEDLAASDLRRAAGRRAEARELDEMERRAGTQ